MLSNQGRCGGGSDWNPNFGGYNNNVYGGGYGGGYGGNFGGRVCGNGYRGW